VRNKALAVGAERWLRDLPGSVAEIEREWSITVGRSYEDPTEAFVAEATLDDGTPAVLKVHVPRAGDHACTRSRSWGWRPAPAAICPPPTPCPAWGAGPPHTTMSAPSLELLHGDPRERARWLAARCGLDATAIWEWGVAERVATGLVLTKIELLPVGRQMLATADHVTS
jgi:hypothetical protein